MQDQPSADQETAALKLPPHSLEAEQSVLGGLMLDNQAWDNVSERLVADDFYRYEHRLVFNVMIHLAESGQPLDVVTLSEALEALVGLENDALEDELNETIKESQEFDTEKSED